MGAIEVSVVGTGVSSAQLWVLVAGAGWWIASVSLGLRGTISKLSVKGSSATGTLVSHCSAPAALAEASSTLVAGGTADSL